MKTRVIAGLFLLLLSYPLQAQIRIHRDTTEDLTFTGTRVNQYSQEYDTTGKITFGGYIDAYYAGYTDTLGPGGYAKFPTVAPRNNQFGINIVQFGARYQSNRFRGQATLFFGDTPDAAWSPRFNFIQEANLGFRIAGKFWLDAGFFRTHIGLESIQPRENITMSIATTTYFEPYYMSGAKLTWEHSPKWTFQINAFNGFNNFLENNSNKALGASVVWTPNEHWSTTLSTIVCDESPDGYPQDKTRSYTNLISVFKSYRWTVGLEANYGVQTNSQLKDSTGTAMLFSFIGAFKYRITPKWAPYVRGEFFSDPDEILTGPVINENHELTGLDIVGATVGFEYKPIPNSYFRIEGRGIHAGNNERIFYYNNRSTNIRYEVIAGIGVWF